MRRKNKMAKLITKVKGGFKEAELSFSGAVIKETNSKTIPVQNLQCVCFDLLEEPWSAVNHLEKIIEKALNEAEENNYDYVYFKENGIKIPNSKEKKSYTLYVVNYYVNKESKG